MQCSPGLGRAASASASAELAAREPAAWEMVVREQGLIRTSSHHNRRNYSRSRRTTLPRHNCLCNQNRSSTGEVLAPVWWGPAAGGLVWEPAVWELAASELAAPELSLIGTKSHHNQSTHSRSRHTTLS